MTAAEKTQYQGWFPLLDVNAVVVTAENNPTYNCISWTVGVTSTWHWPGSSIQDFDTFYASFGYVRRDTGPIAAWGHNFQDMLHGSVSGPSHGPRWESKCGGLLRIQHGRDELTSNDYGRILAYYRFNWLRYILTLIVRIWWKPIWWRWAVTPDQIRSLDQAVAALDPEVRDRFERLFEEWKRGWSDPEVLIHSNPQAVRRLPQFEALLELGEKTLPALARKLANPENFFALQLYDALSEKGAAPKMSADRSRRAGEQARAEAAAATIAHELRRSESRR